MFATVKTTSKKKLVAVVTRLGSLITKNSNSIDCIMLTYGKNSSCHLSGTLETWAKKETTTPVYEGDTVTLQF